jgi:hypothetical protein
MIIQSLQQTAGALFVSSDHSSAMPPRLLSLGVSGLHRGFVPQNIR